MSYKNNVTNLSISVSDPLLYYIRILSYRNKLSSIIDNLIIGIAGCGEHRSKEETEVLVPFFNKLAASTPNVKLQYFSGHAGCHGSNIRALVKDNYNELNDVVLITEDDDFIINEQELSGYIDRIKNNELDFIGESRGCTNNNEFMEFQKKIIAEDNLVENLVGQFFPHFWPTHFLVNKKHLRPDDIFENYLFKKDTEIDFRGRKYKFEYDTTADTFVKFSVDLWNRINKAREHKVYTLGTPEYVDKLGYCLRSGLLYDWLKLEAGVEELLKKVYQFHIGSATCLLGFWNNNISILEHNLFKQIKQYWESGDYNTVIEMYRRYYIYKCIFNVVKDDLEFKEFKEGYEQNFAIVDKYFSDIKIHEVIATKDYKMMPEFVFETIFKYIISK